MRIPNQSAGVARNLRPGSEPGEQASPALVLALRRRSPDGEPNGVPEETTRCRPCNSNGWQECTTYLFGRPIQTFTRACTNCGPCQLDLTGVVPGQTLDPAALRFTRQCVRGGNASRSPCSRCSPETRIGLPWPASDRCIKFCCSALDPGSCSVSARTC
jgi:hypothetical protein